MKNRIGEIFADKNFIQTLLIFQHNTLRKTLHAGVEQRRRENKRNFTTELISYLRKEDPVKNHIHLNTPKVLDNLIDQLKTAEG